MTVTVAIVGRPNVGKSTLFNRLCGKKLALVHDTPGLTRDWRLSAATLFDLQFDVMDTAGLEENFDDSIQGRMRRQTEDALDRADVAVLVIDARAGITPMDRHFADYLRRGKKPCLLVANKCESSAADAGLYEAYELGLGAPITVSAEHNIGMDDLASALKPYVQGDDDPEDIGTDDDDDIEKLLQDIEEGAETGFGDLEAPEEDSAKPIRLAIVGRPNVGKSTLLNALVGEQRSMTGPEAGITRDAVHVDWEFKDRAFRLVDTAGLRRKAKIVDKIERMSAEDSLRAIRLAEIVVIVLDGNDMFSHQDLAIAAHVINEGRALVIAVNKWDTVKNRDEQLEELRRQLEHSLAQVRDIPFVTISAQNKLRLERLMHVVLDTHTVWNRRVPTGNLNRWLARMESRHPAPLVNGKPNRLRYVTQIKTRPPTFALWVGRADDYPETHKRYLISGLRRDFDIPGVPVRVVVKTSKNPYVD